LQEAYRTKPATAKAVFSSKSQLTTGFLTAATIRDKFTVSMDEPKALGGSDTAPNPVEVLLAALCGCQEIAWKAYAQATGIPIESVSVEIHGDIDFRGFFAVSDEVRPGFERITGTVTVKSSASTEELEGLKRIVDVRCPVSDMLQAVPTTITLKHEPVQGGGLGASRYQVWV
jgi:putative redox protein